MRCFPLVRKTICIHKENFYPFFLYCFIVFIISSLNIINDIVALLWCRSILCVFHKQWFYLPYYMLLCAPVDTCVWFGRYGHFPPISFNQHNIPIIFSSDTDTFPHPDIVSKFISTISTYYYCPSFLFVYEAITLFSCDSYLNSS